ncbi:hypothetical protein SIE_00001, partial [Enterococcus faecium EnGen0153]
MQTIGNVCPSSKSEEESNASFLKGQAVMGREIIVPKFLMSHCREKLLVRKQRPVPQTDTGSRGENPKVSERT